MLMVAEYFIEASQSTSWPAYACTPVGRDITRVMLAVVSRRLFSTLIFLHIASKQFIPTNVDAVAKGLLP